VALDVDRLARVLAVLDRLAVDRPADLAREDPDDFALERDRLLELEREPREPPLLACGISPPEDKA
jgi:hypothetical protein